MPLLPTYAVLSIVYLVVRAFEVPTWLALVTKPAPFVLLLVAIARGMPVQGRRAAIVAAVVFSIGGDELLALPRSTATFQAGLGSFLVAHLFYVGAFLRRPVFTPKRTFAALLAIPWGVGLNLLLAPNLGPNAVPVAAYSVVLLAMYVTTVLSQGVPGRAVAGAVAFCLSDSLLAMQLFGFAFPGGGLVSMALYDMAQWLLVTTPEADRRAV